MTEKQKYGFMVKVAVLTIICIQYTVTISTPTMGQIAQLYPEYPTMVKQIETIPTLAAIIPSLLIGPLNKYLTKKTMLQIGTILAFAQIIPAFVDGFMPLYISRFIAGLGLGFMYSFAASFIVDMFDGKEQNMMMGLRSAIGAIAGMVFLQLSGQIAAHTITDIDPIGTYQPSFYLVLILIPIFLINQFFMPKTNPIEEANRAAARAPKTANAGPKEKNFTGLTWALIIMTVVNICFLFTFMSNASIIASVPTDMGGLGGTPADAGNVMTLFSAAMAVSGFIFGPIWMRFLKNYTTAAGIAACFVGLVICLVAKSIPVLFVGAIIFGFGFQMYNGAICLLLPNTARPAAATTIIAVFFAFQNAGSFLATLITPNISKALVNAGVLTDVGAVLRADWYVAVVGAAVCVVIYFILCAMANKRIKAREAQAAEKAVQAE